MCFLLVSVIAEDDKAKKFFKGKGDEVVHLPLRLKKALSSLVRYYKTNLLEYDWYGNIYHMVFRKAVRYGKRYYKGNL